MIATDYVGLGALISATGAAIVSIIVALKQRPLAAKVEEVHTQVTTSNGETLAQLVEKNDARHDKDSPPSRRTP